VVADDVQCSTVRRLLSWRFISRRLESTRTLLVIGLREGSILRFDQHTSRRSIVRPLNETASMQLLDQVAPELEAQMRRRVLDEAVATQWRWLNCRGP